MTATMNDAIVIHQQELVVSLSIGISIYPDDGVSIEQTLNRAELAVREAKNTTRKSFRIQGRIANDDLKARVIIGSELRKAIKIQNWNCFISHRSARIRIPFMGRRHFRAGIMLLLVQSHHHVLFHRRGDRADRSHRLMVAGRSMPTDWTMGSFKRCTFRS
jgi:hypothetical protein